MRKILFFAALCCCAMAATAQIYDFTAISGTNTIYYKITDADKLEVAVVSETIDKPYYNTKPTGTLVIPETVNNGDTDYSVTTIGNNAFQYCNGLTGTLTIPNSVTTIGESACYNCIGLTGLTIPNSVTTIGQGAFYNCTGLTGTLTIPNSVTTIDEHAFYNCTSLTGTLTIPNSVTTIGKSAFYNCKSLTEITCKAQTPPSLGTESFENIPTTADFFVPCGTEDTYKAAPNWSDIAAKIHKKQVYNFSAESNDIALGTVALTGTDCEARKITATPTEGNEFKQWSDGSTDNPYTLSIVQDTALVATFATMTAIENASSSSSAVVYAQGRNIVVENATGEVYIYNTMGQQISHFSLSNTQSVTVPSAGVYLVKVGNEIRKVAVKQMHWILYLFNIQQKGYQNGLLLCVFT